ncbi:MAG: carbamoyltransferase HypF [Butyrivibrio sp.]|nr:carbamoyltransferase HypF [Butyrivibrio sp.]
MEKSLVVYELTIYGLVQGVGFRPFVAELAEQNEISGTVRNAGGIVHAVFAGKKADVEKAISILKSLDGHSELLPGARVDSIEISDNNEIDTDSRQVIDAGQFKIIDSTDKSDRIRFLPADIATCDRCAKELNDKNNRRYRHPFISCVSCGPRFSIMEKVPYDRDTVTMKDFELCPKCHKEYTEQGNIRRHAQTICCKECGPELVMYLNKDAYERLDIDIDASGSTISENESNIIEIDNRDNNDVLINVTATAIKKGLVVAIKNVGGYHFAFDAKNSEPAKRLRTFKNREKKPFAVMFSSIEEIKKYCEVSETEEKLLTGTARPIVLLRKKEISGYNADKNVDINGLSMEVCGESHYIGAMLPCDPVQILLLKECGPLVMTSGNLGGEPIITDNERMLELMEKTIPEVVLANNRDIYNGLDDSIYQVTKTKTREVVQIIRRARGLVPEPVIIDKYFDEDIFAAGGDLKNAFALGRDNFVFLSGHYGDLEEYAAQTKRRDGIDHMVELLGIEPVEYACDKHPAYYSSKDIRDNEHIEIQHHYAHIMSVVAEYSINEPVLGIAIDGTGYGDDKTIWGGEFLLCHGIDYKRKGHLQTVTVAGGDQAARKADQLAMSYIYSAIKANVLPREDNPYKADSRMPIIEKAVDNKINTAGISSIGRLFDAVSAILGICTENTFEGECPSKLQAAAENYEKTPNTDNNTRKLFYHIENKDGVFIANTNRLIADIIRLKKCGFNAEKIAYEFHQAIADMCLAMCDRILRDTAVNKIAISGGSAYNALLLRLLLPKLEKAGYEVYINEKVPSGDGGLALGQAYIMAINDSYMK